MPPMPPMPPPPPMGMAGLSSGSSAHGRFGGDEQAGDRGRILQRGADDLGRVDHAGLDEVLVHVGLRR